MKCPNCPSLNKLKRKLYDLPDIVIVNCGRLDAALMQTQIDGVLNLQVSVPLSTKVAENMIGGRRPNGESSVKMTTKVEYQMVCSYAERGHRFF